MTDCPFCQIANKETEAVIVFDDNEIMAFLDIIAFKRRTLSDNSKTVY